jgi:hypothetical protein
MSSKNNDYGKIIIMAIAKLVWQYRNRKSMEFSKILIIFSGGNF